MRQSKLQSTLEDNLGVESVGPVRNLKTTGVMTSYNLSAQKYKRGKVVTQELPMKT